MSALQLRTGQLADDVVVIDVAGSLDSHTHGQLEALVARLFKERHYKIVFRLDRLDYLASAGAGAFIAANAEAQDHGGGICFLQPSRSARDVLNVLGLDRLLPFAQDEETAVDVLQ